MKKLPVIIDCDPGHDDALMLMLAFGSGLFDVKAVTTSAGNQTQEKTLANTLKILSLIGANVPVYRGCEKPLLRNLVIAEYVHGENGLHGVESLMATLQADTISAVEGIARILSESEEKITIVPTGPLTNIAAFLLAFPNLKDKIERISLMGGGISRGNMTPLAEFNIYVDPEAAAIVFASEIPITMCGLDVTHRAVVFQKDIDLFRAIGNKTGEAAANILEFYSRFYRENRIELEGGAALHDPCAIAWLINPDLFKTKSCYVAIETKGELTSGATVVDFYDVLKKTPNAEVAYYINREEYIKMLEDAIRNLP